MIWSSNPQTEHCKQRQGFPRENSLLYTQRSKSRNKDKLLEPLRTAASRVADLLLEISDCSELFVTESDGRYKKLDAKALKEFSAVIKEVGSVICELNGINGDDEKETCGIQIEFDSEAEECSK